MGEESTQVSTIDRLMTDNRIQPYLDCTLGQIIVSLSGIRPDLRYRIEPGSINEFNDSGAGPIEGHEFELQTALPLLLEAVLNLIDEDHKEK